jgi:hypothetical protein
MLDVEVGDDRDAGLENGHDVLPALLVRARTRHVGMRQLIDEDHGGVSLEYGVQVHLLPDRVPIHHAFSRQNGEGTDLLDRVGRWWVSTSPMTTTVLR